MRKDFTLIELMIVVAIIGILAAIAVPKFMELAACSDKRSQKCQQYKRKMAEARRERQELQGEASDNPEEEITINGQTYRRVP